MRLALLESPAPGKASPKLSTAWAAGLALAAVAVVAAANLTYNRLSHRSGAASGDGAGGQQAQAGDAKKPGHDPTTTVVMPEGKFRSAGIRVEPAREVELPQEVRVVGHIEAETNRRVDVRPKAQGVVRSVAAQTGARVRKGDVLAVLDSPDVGAARLLVRERQRTLSTVRIEAAWKAEIAANTEALIAQLRKGIAPETLAKQFADRRLGAARGTLLSAYADLEIASHEAEKMADLNQRKIVGEHPLFLAQHTREAAQAKFDAALESVGFDVAQQDRVARQAARNAEEMVIDAAQRLRVLGVSEDIAELLAHPERASALPSGSEDLTTYPVAAPFDATVLSTSTVASQRVEVTDTLFVLADLAKVYAVANIPESDFAALPALGGGRVGVTAKAYPGRAFEARMLYTGSEVDPITRTIRLVAEAENPDGLLVPNMFIQIALDTKAVERVTTVPAGSVVDVEGKPAVFVSGEGERTFVIRPVKLGREALGRQVIAEGLRPGDPVVADGAFVVKSELILQNETDEE